MVIWKEIEHKLMFGIENNIQNVLGEITRTWKTESTSYGETLGEVRRKREIFQRDSLSPLIFVLSMILPLTLVLRKTGIGYEWRKKQLKINHLSFMDDPKLFWITENQTDALINSVPIFSADVGMEFGLKKCGSLILKRGKMVATEGVVVLDRQIMRQIEKDRYKHVVVLETDKIEESEMKATFGKKKEIQKLDGKTRRVMIMYGALHPKSDVERIYVPRKNGGRGLTSCENCIRRITWAGM